MSLVGALTVVNAMKADGIISAYAVGGAVAAFLYIEPGSTFDLDIFIPWTPGPGGLLTVVPIYDYLSSKGYASHDDAVEIEGWDVQFLPLGTPLAAEALAQAIPMEIEGVPIRAFSPEHLMAVCLDTGRLKDSTRLAEFLQHARFDESKFRTIVNRHDLEAKWINFQNKFMNL